MEKFNFEVTRVKPENMEKFLKKVEMPMVEDLSFWLLTNVGDIFTNLCKKEWPNLKKLKLPSTGILD